MSEYIKYPSASNSSDTEAILGTGSNIVYVNSSGSDLTGNGSLAFPFASIGAAEAYITTASNSNPFTLSIGPGVQTLPSGFNKKNGIHWIGSGEGRVTRILADDGFVNISVSDPITTRCNFSNLLFNVPIIMNNTDTNGAFFMDIDTCKLNGFPNGSIQLNGSGAGNDNILITNCQIGNGIDCHASGFEMHASHVANQITIDDTGLIFDPSPSFVTILCSSVGEIVISGGSFLEINGAGSPIMADGAGTFVFASADTLGTSATSAFTNGAVLVRSTDAYGVSYNPTTPSDWPNFIDLATVSDGLDQLAAERVLRAGDTMSGDLTITTIGDETVSNTFGNVAATGGEGPHGFIGTATDHELHILAHNHNCITTTAPPGKPFSTFMWGGTQHGPVSDYQSPFFVQNIVIDSNFDNTNFIQGVDLGSSGNSPLWYIDYTGLLNIISIDCAARVRASGIESTSYLLSNESGAQPFQGAATLVGGAATISTSAVDGNSRIFVTSQSDGGVPGFLRVTARSTGVDFTVTSSSIADTSRIAWIIFPGTYP